MGILFAFGQLLRDPLAVRKGDSVHLRKVLQHLVCFCGIASVGVGVAVVGAVRVAVSSGMLESDPLLQDQVLPVFTSEAPFLLHFKHTLGCVVPVLGASYAYPLGQMLSQ